MGLKPLAYVTMAAARPLLPIAAQMMAVGYPLIKALNMDGHYSALIRMLDDEETAEQFRDYLYKEGA